MLGRRPGRAKPLPVQPNAKHASHRLRNLTAKGPFPPKNVVFLNPLLANQARPIQQLDNQTRRFIVNPIDPATRCDRYREDFLWVLGAGIALECGTEEHTPVPYDKLSTNAGKQSKQSVTMETARTRPSDGKDP